MIQATNAGTTAPAPGGQAAGPGTDLASRRHQRERLGVEPPARILLASRQSIFITLSDISPGGCCIVRRGQLELSRGDTVMLEIWTQDISSKISIQSLVCWTSHAGDLSRAGLRFVENNHRLLRQIELYAQHFVRPRDSGRPVANMPEPGHSRAARPEQSLPESRPSPAPGRQRLRPAPSGARPARGHGALASMPRPGRLTSLDLRRRMRPIPRHEVARIAEETGLHVHTLYGWLRTLQLEDDRNPSQLGDPDAWSASEKVAALRQIARLSPDERAWFCRQNGLEEQHLQRWRAAALQASDKPLLMLRAEEELQRLRLDDQREIRRLRKGLRRKERSAKIGAELLQLVRHLQALLEQQDAG